jgi:hypothetical protein
MNLHVGAALGRHPNFHFVPGKGTTTFRASIRKIGTNSGFDGWPQVADVQICDGNHAVCVLALFLHVFL